MCLIIAIFKGKTVNISLKQIVIKPIYVVNYTVVVVVVVRIVLHHAH